MTTPPLVDGRGGSQWYTNINMPTYDPDYDFQQNVTWADIEDWTNTWNQINATAGVSLGLCLMGMLSILALTPAAKRGRQLFNLSLLTLTILIWRYLAILIGNINTGVGSAYYQIIGKGGINFTLWTHVTVCMIIWTSPFAFVFVQLCFFLQACAVLSLFKTRHVKMYYSLISCLIFLGSVSICFRFAEASYNSISWFRPDLVEEVPRWLHKTDLALFSASIFSWSLVFTVQVGLIIWNRLKLGLRMHRNEAMSVLMMTGIESMLFPIIFDILQLCQIPWFQRAEYLILPSVAIILPFGSILAGAAELNQNRAPPLDGDHNTCRHCHELIHNKAAGRGSKIPTPNPFSPKPSAPSTDRIFQNDPDDEFDQHHNHKPKPDPSLLSNSTYASPITPTAARHTYSSDKGPLLSGIEDDENNENIMIRRQFTVTSPGPRVEDV